MIGTAGTVVVFRRLERPARSSSETIACCLLAIVFCPLKGARATMSKSHSSNCARPAGAFLRTIGLVAGLATLGTGAIVLIHDYMGVDIKALWEITQRFANSKAEYPGNPPSKLRRLVFSSTCQR